MRLLREDLIRLTSLALLPKQHTQAKFLILKSQVLDIPEHERGTFLEHANEVLIDYCRDMERLENGWKFSRDPKTKYALSFICVHCFVIILVRTFLYYFRGAFDRRLI